MKVNISGITTFHIVNLATQMDRLGHLNLYLTALPPGMTPGVSKAKIRRIPVLLGPAYLSRKLKLSNLERHFEKPSRELFKRWLASTVTECDVFHSLSGFGLPAHKIVKDRYGALTVCDRGSTHILFQKEILEEEFELWNVPFTPFDPLVVDTELAEYEYCDLITVPTHFVANTFHKKGVPMDKIAIIPYGVDLEMFYPVKKEDGRFRVLYAGQISYRKGIPYLLNAFSDIKLPDFELVLLGKVQPEIASYFYKNLGNGHYFGLQKRSDLSWWYSQSSVFVIASIEEGLATVIAQAMACALPIVATQNSGAEELVTDGIEGFIIPARDPEILREKVLYLYENPEIRENMGRAALEKVKAINGWNQYGESIAKTYAQSLSEIRSR